MSAAAGALPSQRRAEAALTTAWLTSVAAFDAIAGEWDALAAASGTGHPFVLHAWLSTWWASFGGGAALRIATVRAGDRLVAAAPLMLKAGRMYGVRTRILQAIADDHTPRYEFLVDGGRRDDAFDALWDAIRARRHEWDLLVLRQLPADSPTRAALLERAHRDGCGVGEHAGERSPFVRFHGAWNRYFDSLGYNHRRNIGKAQRRLERTAPVALEVVDGGPSVRADVEAGMAIEARAWKADAGTAMLSDPAVQGFYLALAERLAARGLLRLYFLRHGGERIAFSYALVHRGTVFVLKGGYEPGHARYTPYNVLCKFVLRRGFADGLAGYDFLGDDDRWKRGWARQVREHRWLYVRSSTFRASLVHALKFRVAPALRKLGIR